MSEFWYAAGKAVENLRFTLACCYRPPRSKGPVGPASGTARTETPSGLRHRRFSSRRMEGQSDAPFCATT